MRPTVFNHKQYTDLEADYMILKAENEQLKAQLSATNNRLEAAVEDIYKMTDGGECDICKHYNPDKNTCAKPFVPYDDCFEWRGPQEKGDKDE